MSILKIKQLQIHIIPTVIFLLTVLHAAFCIHNIQIMVKPIAKCNVWNEFQIHCYFSDGSDEYTVKVQRVQSEMKHEVHI